MSPCKSMRPFFPKRFLVLLILLDSPAALGSAKAPNIAVSTIFCAAKRRPFKAVGRFFDAATPAPPLCPSTSVLRDFPFSG
jgi:hypothetical protein